MFGAKVDITPNHHSKFYPSEGFDNTYSPNSLSPLSQISPVPPLQSHSTTPPPTPPPPPQSFPTFLPRSPFDNGGMRIPPKVTPISKPSPVAPWPQWPVKSVTSDFSEAMMRPSFGSMKRLAAVLDQLTKPCIDTNYYLTCPFRRPQPQRPRNQVFHHQKAREEYATSAMAMTVIRPT